MQTTVFNITASQAIGKASSPRKQRNKPYAWNLMLNQFSVSKVITLISVIIVIAAVISSFQAVDTLLDVPVESVSIEGDSQFVSKKAIQKIIHDSSVDGFVGLDLSMLHDKLQALPWISQVSIKRLIPNRLIIYIEEEAVLASWNNNAYITQNGDIITPENQIFIPDLPHFSGENHGQMLNFYQFADKMLAAELKPVKSISVSQIGAVTLKLATDTDLILASNNFQEQLGRWMTIYEASLQYRIQEIHRADLRYANGLAVAFKNNAKNNNKFYIGGSD